MKLRVTFTALAWSQYIQWQSEDKAMVKRINRLIDDVQRDPHGVGIGKPELLKGPLSGWASRRITGEHRMIYQVRGTDLIIAACSGHYGHD